MKLCELSKTELESMSYDDIAYQILLESNEKLKINDLFKKVCDLLDLGEDVFTNQIADFFSVLSTDQRFIMLNNGFWDIKSKHSAKVVLDLEEDDDIVSEALEEDDDFEVEEENDDKIFYDDDDTDDDDDDDLKNLVIIDEDETNSVG